MNDRPIRVRYAPSPTGYLHVGGARTLLFNWLYAKKMKGTLVLRVEDTDQARSTPENEKMILEDVKRLGLHYDEGPGREGEYGPYRQSERLPIYAKYAQELLQKDLVYPCFCTDEELTRKRELAMKLKRPPHYDGTCAKLSAEEVARRYQQGQRAGLRFRVPHRSVILRDHVRGQVEFKAGMVGDFFITRSPTDEELKAAQKTSGRSEPPPLTAVGMPVYNFCCVIDDHLMEMSHVIRGEDHLSNTSRQLLIYEALGWAPPEFAHTAMVLGGDRQKLSKRNGDVAVFDYLEKGYCPETLLNFLALLGWWPPAGTQPRSGHPEVLSMDELIECFDLGGLQKAPAIFDLQKLQWMNGFYLKNMPLGETEKRALPFYEKAGLSREKIASHPAGWFSSLIQASIGEAHLLSELPTLSEAVWSDRPPFEPEAQAVLKEGSSQPVIQSLIEVLNGMSSETLSQEDVVQIQKAVAAKTGAKGKALFMPIRAAITGKTHGAEMKLILPLLGKTAALGRVSQFMGRLQEPGKGSS